MTNLNKNHLLFVSTTHNSLNQKWYRHQHSQKNRKPYIYLEDCKHFVKLFPTVSNFPQPLDPWSSDTGNPTEECKSTSQRSLKWRCQTLRQQQQCATMAQETFSQHVPGAQGLKRPRVYIISMSESANANGTVALLQKFFLADHSIEKSKWFPENGIKEQSCLICDTAPCPSFLAFFSDWMKLGS